MRLHTLVTIVCVCGVLAACGGSPAPKEASKEVSKETPLLTGEQLKQEVERFRASKGFPGLAVVIVNQDKIETAVSGRRRVDAPDLLQPTDLFQIGSQTKAVTGMLLSRLVEQKKLRWDSTLSEIFPAWRSRMRPEFLGLTVEQLMHHQSGLPRDFSDADFEGLRAQMSGNPSSDRANAGLWFLQQPALFVPGTQSLYSNIGYMVAGLVAEAVAGDSYENLMAKEVWAPLQMKGAFGYPEDAGAGTPAGHTMGASGWQVAQYAPETRLWLSAVAAAGGLVLAPQDYGRLLREQLRGLQGQSSYLAQASYRRMHTPVNGYGFGWVVSEAPQVGTVSWHNGTTGSYYSTNRLIPGQNRAIEVICNCHSDGADQQIEEFAASLIGLGPKK